MQCEPTRSACVRGGRCPAGPWLWGAVTAHDSPRRPPLRGPPLLTSPAQVTCSALRLDPGGQCCTIRQCLLYYSSTPLQLSHAPPTPTTVHLPLLQLSLHPLLPSHPASSSCSDLIPFATLLITTLAPGHPLPPTRISPPLCSTLLPPPLPPPSHLPYPLRSCPLTTPLLDSLLPTLSAWHLVPLSTFRAGLLSPSTLLIVCPSQCTGWRVRW